MRRTYNFALMGLICGAAILLAMSLPGAARAAIGNSTKTKATMHSRRSPMRRATSAQPPTAVAGIPAAGPGADIRVAEADTPAAEADTRAAGAVGREAAAWAVAAWADGEDNRPIVEAP